MADPTEETYSYSRVTSFTQCPRAYRYRYIEKLREAFTSVEAHLGRAVHAALAWLYETREASETPKRSELLDRFDAEWEAGLGSRVRLIRKDDSFEGRRESGHRMLAEHHAGPFRADRMTTLATEQDLYTRLDGDYRFRGIIDRLARDVDGVLHVVDYKTTGRPPAILDPEKTLQIRSYGMLAIEHHGAESARLTFQFLTNGQEWSGNCRLDDRPAVAGELAARIAEIETASDFPARSSALCAWCGYRDICEASGFQNGRAAGGPIRCPRCDGRLRERNGRFGAFLGCENYPACRFTRDP
jgi:putative RecB family exonuclease